MTGTVFNAYRTTRNPDGRLSNTLIGTTTDEPTLSIIIATDAESFAEGSSYLVGYYTGASMPLVIKFEG